MHLRETLFQPGNKVKIILKRQIGMQAPDDVKLRDRFRVSGRGGLEGFFESHGIGSRRIFFAAKGAKTASSHTNIGGIDVAIDVEICPVAMHSLADRISQPPHSQDIATAIERERVFRTEALPGNNLLRRRLKLRVFCLKRMS